MKKLLLSTLLYCLSLVVPAPVLANENTISLIIHILLLQEDPGIVKPLSFSWQHPGQREDGSPLNISNLKNYQIRYRDLDDAGPYRLVLLDAMQLSTSITLNVEAGDRYEFAIRTIDKDGLASAYTPGATIEF